MSGKRITGLGAATAVASTDQLPIDGSGFTEALSCTAAKLGVLAGNTVWVDKINGSDSTGLRGYRARPFLTCAAAQTAASSGDTIIVLPGSHTVTAMLGKNGVNWFLMPGAVLSGDDVVLVIFNATSAITFSVYGYGSVRSDDATDLINVNHASANVTIDLPSLTTVLSTNLTILLGAGTLTIRRAIITTSNDTGSIDFTGGALTLDNCEIRNSLGRGIDISGVGTLILKNGVIVTPAGQESLWSESSVNVKVYGHAMATRAKSAPVTVSCGTFEVDTDVT